MSQANIHHIQIGIIRTLVFEREATFSELNIFKVGNDQMNFHLKRLMELGYITKDEDKKVYSLTLEGKQYSSLLDTDNHTFEKQAKIGVCLSSIREQGGEAQYLIQQRLKEPFFGFYGFLTGKLRFGETVEEGAKREFEEETGLTCTPKLVDITHKMDYSPEGEILDDKYFFVFNALDVSGNFIESFEGGKNHWMALKDIKALPQDMLFDRVYETIEVLKNPAPSFTEFKCVVEGF